MAGVSVWGTLSGHAVPLRLMPDYFQDVGIVLCEGGICGCKTPNGDSNDINRDGPRDTNQRITFLNYLPVRSGNGVREDISVEHPDGAGKPCQRILSPGVVDGDINSGKALRPPRQCLISFSEILEELVISADIGWRGY
jgi:hypothetical protein